MIAEVIINRTAKKLNRTFDYNIPKDLEDLITVGSKILVPFGNRKELEEAFVVGIKEKSTYQVKDIAKIQENLTTKQIELARWMAKRYFCTVSDCIKLMLTPGTRTLNKENRIENKKINTIYLKKEREEIEFDIETQKIKSDKQIRILNFVKQNEGVTIPEIEAFTDCSRAIVNTLIKNGYLEMIEKEIQRNPLLAKKEPKKTFPLALTQEQRQAYLVVGEAIQNEKYDAFLLYGVTGSRKNRSLFTINRKSNEKK